MEISKKRSLPITHKQKELLTDYISQRPEMYIGRLTSDYTKENMKKNWIEITNMLNSVPNGPAKEWTQWRKVSIVCFLLEKHEYLIHNKILIQWFYYKSRGIMLLNLLKLISISLYI